MTVERSVIITVSGPDDQLISFVKMAKTIEFLCVAGASRTIEIDVDGDGSGALRFDYGKTNVEGINPASIDDDPIRLTGIGE